MRTEDLGKLSIRRNRLICDLLLRAKLIEAVGSGVDRITKALQENGNPTFAVAATNFFNITFFSRPEQLKSKRTLTERQRKLLHFIDNNKSVSKRECAEYLNVSEDTALRELKFLIKAKLLSSKGRSTATRYVQV